MVHRKTKVELNVVDPVGFDLNDFCHYILPQLNSIGFDVYADHTPEPKPSQSFTIDSGTISTDSATFYKLIEFCGENDIKLTIVNGHINLNVEWDQ